MFLKNNQLKAAAKPIKEEAYLKDLYPQYFCSQEVNVFLQIYEDKGKIKLEHCCFPVHTHGRQRALQDNNFYEICLHSFKYCVNINLVLF